MAEIRVELAADEKLTLLDWGRETKYHVPGKRRIPGSVREWTLCGMSLWGSPGTKFEDEVAPEDICKTCLRYVDRSTDLHGGNKTDG